MDSAGENTVNSVETATSGSEGLQNRKSQLGFAARDDATDRKLGRWQRCSVSTTVMGTLIGLIWALWVFFIVLYYTDLANHSDQVLINESSAIATTTNEHSDCQSQNNMYTGDICMTVLHTYRACLTDRNASADTDIFISLPSGMSQEEVEADVVELLGGLQLLNPGNEMEFETADNSSGLVTNNSMLDCSVGFYQEEDSGTCLPECGVWQIYSNRLEIGIKVLMLLLTSIGIVAGAIVLVIACIQHKKMLKFPNSLIVYQTATVLVNSVTVLISFTDSTALFCTSRNLVETFSNTSPYCTFTDVTGFCLLLVIFWTIWKKQLQQRIRARKHQIGTAEVKALIIVTYFLAIGIYAAVLFGINFQVWPKGRFSQVLTNYLLCESTTPGTCDRSMIAEAVLTGVLLDVALILLGLFPVINIIYVVNIREMRKIIQGSMRKLRSLSRSITGISKISLQTQTSYI